jgi:excisionase family DNA binding protein
MSEPKARTWLTPKQAADFLQVTPMTVYRYIKNGTLEASQLVPRGTLRISEASLEKLMAKRPILDSENPITE